jgi:hypothetical protein
MYVDLRPGTLRDAILHSVGANEEHGQPRTNLDKHKAVKTMLSDEEWGTWTDNRIAGVCKVSHTFVTSVRQELSCNGCKIDNPVRTVQRGGSEFKMNTANIGKAPATVHPDDDFADEPGPVSGELNGYGQPANAVVAAMSLAPETTTLEQRAANAEIIYDSMAPAAPVAEPAPVREADLSDCDWLRTVPLWAWAQETGAPCLFLERDALIWRGLQSALGKFRHAVHEEADLKLADTPLTQILRQVIHVPHPRDWKGCSQCRAKPGGCTKCQCTGYSLDTGVTVEQMRAKR